MRRILIAGFVLVLAGACNDSGPTPFSGKNLFNSNQGSGGSSNKGGGSGAGLSPGSGGSVSPSCVNDCEDWASSCDYPDDQCSALCQQSPSVGECLNESGCSTASFSDCLEGISGAGGTSGSGGFGGSSGFGGSGGSGGSSGNCSTQWEFFSPACDSCMRSECCSWLQQCDSGSDCRLVDDCRFDYCTSSSNLMDCMETYCDDFGPDGFETWQNYYSCMSSQCASPCAG